MRDRKAQKRQMGPPVDPWGEPTDPLSATLAEQTDVLPPQRGTRPMYGRAPVTPPVLREPTAEMLEMPAPTRPSGRPVSWQRTSSATRRSIADGWGLSATGLLVAFCGWGLWAAAGRGTIAAPLVGLGLMLVVAAGLFGLSRLLSFIVLTQMLHRRRPHARWAHFAAGAFLAVAGISYLANTSWLTDAGDWVSDGLDWIGAQWKRVEF